MADVIVLLGAPGSGKGTQADMLKDLLVENQIKDGLKKGAWEDRYFKWGNYSDIYPTALNIMILETYYRYYR